MKKIILFIIIMSSFIYACESSDNTVSIEVEKIDKIDVANGTTGVFIVIEDESTIEKIQDLIKSSSYINKDKTEDKAGWTIGVRIYYDDHHHWYMPDGVDGLKYEENDFYVSLLDIILEEKEIDFVREYVNRNKETD